VALVDLASLVKWPAIVAGAGVFLALVAWRLKRAGRAEAERDQSRAVADARERMGEAATAAPRGRAEVVERLRRRGL
jgi:chaperonin GroEL (HSP60 family)